MSNISCDTKICTDPSKRQEYMQHKNKYVQRYTNRWQLNPQILFHAWQEGNITPITSLKKVEYIYYLVILADDHTLGHMAWDLSTRYIENYWFIKTNNSHSAYALHILKNGHEYYTLPMTMKLIKKMNVSMTDQVHAYAKQQEKF